MIDVCQYPEYASDSEYAMVLNMLGSHKIVNKVSLINIWQGSEFASSSGNTSVTQGSLENSPSYMFDRFLIIRWAFNLSGLEYANKGREYAKVRHVSA